MLIPLFTFADAGSAILWFSYFHLVILNFFIGLIESVILDRFKLPNRLWLVILANYVSAFFGLTIIAPYFSSLSGNDDFYGWTADIHPYGVKGFIIGMIASYFATLLIEYPFVYFAIKDKAIRKKLPIPFIIANTATYLVMFLLYLYMVL